MNIRVVIVDDEPLARRRIRSLLDEAENIDVVAECANGRDAIEAIETAPPDLLFLDIQMPEVDGFDVLQAIGVGLVPAVIFVTAYDHFALRAFEAHALDYLLKPFDDERFAAALERARTQIRQQLGGELERRLHGLLAQVRGDDAPYLKRLAATTGGRTILIRTEDIDWIEANRNYIGLHVGRHTYVIRSNLTHIESLLDPAMFCRIQRSTIVNIDRIQALESLPNGDYVVFLQNGTKLTSGRSYRHKLHALIGKDVRRPD